ncbi:MAG: PD-(D/E)XK nuclease family protein [Planctomycetota bacterium]|nr:PD-(D/E)XK nuclease family protein [Planctomycetota bacterium]
MRSLAAAAPPSTGTAAGIDLDHLSWSGVSTYNQCPKRFSYRYLEAAPEERKSAALIFGSAFHRAAEQVLQSRLEGRDLPDQASLLATYTGHWKEESDQAPEIVFAKGDDESTLLNLAERMLVAFLEHVRQEAQAEPQRRILALEHADRFRLLPETPPLEARLDVLELDGEDLLVTEIKTSKSRWNDQKVTEALPQLVVYAHALMPLLREIGATRIRPRFLIVTKAKAPVVQVLEPKADQRDVQRLREQLGEVWKGIQANVFPAREGWWCAACPFRVACQGR